MSPAGGVRELVRLRPHAGAHRVALRVGVSVLVPLLVLWLVGRPQWSIYAAFGAFSSLYGRNRVHLTRLRMQATLGLLLTVAVTLGVVVGSTAARAWWSVPVAAVLAGTAAVLSDLQDWHPPGPLFLVFGFAATASVPARGADVPVAAGVAAASALFAVLVGSLGWRGRPDGPQPAPDEHRLAALWRDGTVRLHLVRYLSAVLLAGTIASGLHLVVPGARIGHPYWAMVSAVVPMAARDLTGQLTRAAHRVGGTAVGLGLSVLVLSPHPRGLLLIGFIVVLQVLAELFVGRNYGLALVFITPLALLMGEIVVQHPVRGLLLDRGVETVIGVAVAVGVTVLTRDRSSYPADDAPEPGKSAATGS